MQNNTCYTQSLGCVPQTNSIMTKFENDTSEGLDLSEVASLAEIGCWTAITLFPGLYWANGPAVSADQCAMRGILITVAITGAIGLRIWSVRAKRRVALGSSPSDLETPASIAGESTETSK